MVCQNNKPYYLFSTESGILTAASRNDGYSIAISWCKAYPDVIGYQVVYNIYYATVLKDVFAEGVKFTSISDSLMTEILELTPGDTYFFAVRASEFDPDWVNLSGLPNSGSSKVYPEGALLSDLTAVSASIEISDIETFPTYGVVQIGSELIRYTNLDIPANSLLGLTRGFLLTDPRIHTTDGYDGYDILDPFVKFWKGHEESNEVIFQETSQFNYPNYARTNADGYKTVTKDLLTTDLGGTDASFGSISVTNGGTSDASQAAFPAYDFVGWRRTDPLALLRGDCLDSYYGGEMFCADGYSGVGRQIRGMPIQDEVARREELLLEMTGEPVVLIRRIWTGIRCNCYISTSENPDNRCSKCFGSGFTTGWEQFVNPRRSDGRILIRFEPTEDDLKTTDSGLESTFLPSAWGLVSPAIKDRDILIRYNEDGSREFRYEVLATTRNKLFLGTSGAQKMRLQRVRKTDPLYQIRLVDSMSPMPSVLTTSIGSVPGPGGILPHVHRITIPSSITAISQINGLTSYDASHNHFILNGILSSEDPNHTGRNLGHSHVLTI